MGVLRVKPKEDLTLAVSDLKLLSVLCCLLVAAVSSPSIIAEAPTPPDAKKAPSTLCRFTLGAVFETSDQKNRDGFLKNCELDLKQVVKAFDECKLTVVKKRAGQAEGKQQKDEDLELVVEGKQTFVLKDANKTDISLDVKEIRLIVGRVDRSKTPTRYNFLINFAVDGKHTIKLLGVLEAKHTFTWWFPSPDYHYDAEGKMFDPKTIYSD